MGLNEQGIMQTVCKHGGLLNGEHSKATAAWCDIQLQPPCALHAVHILQNSTGMDMSASVYVQNAYFSPENSRAEYLLKNMKIIFVIHKVLCFT